jgi:uncharacterized protein YbjT (DUF2867 family)
MERVANVVGASGLVGQHLVAQLLSRTEFERIRIFVRRKTGLFHPILEEHVIDFDKPETWRHLVTGVVLFSALGTTLKAAKTKENQYKVDFGYQYEFAKAAAANGVPIFILVSSIGANARSSFFYTRVKGQLEDAVSRLKFKKLVIFRPSILEGERDEKRRGEKFWIAVFRAFTVFFLKNYEPTPADWMASSMIRQSLDETEGIRILEGKKVLW